MPYRRSALMQDRLADNRARIMRCTRHLIARGGFRAARISAVASDAGLSTGSIYRYFPSQAQLFIEVLTAAVAHEIELLERIAAAPEPAAQRLQRAVEAFARRALDAGHRVGIDPGVAPQQRALLALVQGDGLHQVARGRARPITVCVGRVDAPRRRPWTDVRSRVSCRPAWL